MGAGTVAGVAATVVMDAMTELLYTEHIKNLESEISPRGAAAAVALKLMNALDLHPTEKDAERAGRVLHWTIGIG